MATPTIDTGQSLQRNTRVQEGVVVQPVQSGDVVTPELVLGITTEGGQASQKEPVTFIDYTAYSLWNDRLRVHQFSGQWYLSVDGFFIAFMCLFVLSFQVLILIGPAAKKRLKKQQTKTKALAQVRRLSL